MCCPAGTTFGAAAAGFGPAVLGGVAPGLAAVAAVPAVPPGAVPVAALPVAAVPVEVGDGPPSAVAGSAGFLEHAIINAISKTKRLYSNSVRRIETSTVGGFLPERASDSNSGGLGIW
jgi:hypothetical protein